MWNAEFKPGAVPAASLEAELRPEPNPRCCINRFGTSACLRWARVPA